MRRPRTAGVVLAILVAAALPTAAAASTTLQASQQVERICTSSLLPASSSGADSRTWTPPASGYLTVRLQGGPEPDWDLAVFVAGQPGSAASSSSTSIEQATFWVNTGDQVTVQGCRLEGSASTIPLSFDLYQATLPQPSNERISMESVSISGSGDIARLEGMGFDVTHDVGPTSATVVLYSDAGRTRLAAAGFGSVPVIEDLVAADEADRRIEARSAPLRGARALPSDRTTYRNYIDYTTEMKALADANPGLVRSVVVGTTLEGRPIEGVEIAEEVNRADDGRPVYLNFGGHHAREWPSSELPMEFAIDLVNGFKASNPRITSLLQRVRTVIVPVVNVDGFIVSRDVGGETPFDDDPVATLPLIVADSLAYKRKNCRATTPAQQAAPCMSRVAGEGVDLNRNYGSYWGGPGASTNPAVQNYRGTGPYSEPESEAVHQFTSKIHPTVFITNHTFTDDGFWLRQPGFDAPFLPRDAIGALSQDEGAMKSLGDAMGAATGWISERGYVTLGDITGATEDWNYFAQGTYGYTPEIRGTNFHANYAEMVVEEYNGDAAHSGLGAREAFLIAGERAANPADHSIISGNAPPGATLHLRKEFDTATCRADPCNGTGAPFRDVLSTVLTVPASGRYEWHVNPSSRPAAPGVPAQEFWTMTCDSGNGIEPGRTPVGVARGERVGVDFTGGACGRPGPPPVVTTQPGGTSQPGPIRCGGKPVTLIGSSRADAGKRALRGTRGRDVIFGFAGNDRILSRGGNDRICGARGNDKILAGNSRDTLVGSGGADLLRGGGGADRLLGGKGPDRVIGGAGTDLVGGGKGKDRCIAGRRDRTRGCP